MSNTLDLLNSLDSDASAAVSEMFEGQVAFFNIGKKHAFFLCSPDEARHAMDCVREWRNKRNNLKSLQADRDTFKAKIVPRWESVPSRMRLQAFDVLGSDALNHGFSLLEAKFDVAGPVVDLIVVGSSCLADIRSWGHTMYDDTSIEEQKRRGVFARIYGNVDVYLDTHIPKDVVLIGSMPCDGWEGGIARIDVVTEHMGMPG